MQVALKYSLYLCLKVKNNNRNKKEDEKQTTIFKGTTKIFLVWYHYTNLSKNEWQIVPTDFRLYEQSTNKTFNSCTQLTNIESY